MIVRTKFLPLFYQFKYEYYFIREKESQNFMNTLFSLQFVYLRDNLLSTLDGIEVLKRVKVCMDSLLNAYYYLRKIESKLLIF